MARILLVDDDPSARTLASLSLQLEGHHVVHAPEGRTALELLGGEGFDLIVLDLMMPTLDGWAVLRALDPEGPPVIVLSGVSGGFEERQMAPPGRLVSSLRKPYEVDELVAAVEQALAGDAG